jgi:localization factor PodJL
MREVVLAPIESLAGDVRRALAEAGASANFEGVSRQLQEVEGKIEELRQTGGADRAGFLQVFDQSEQIRAMIAQAMEKMAPIERLERQVAGLGERLEDVARQTRDANAAQIALPWGEIESRLTDLATRIDRASFDRAQQPAVDDARFDDISRRLEVMHEALASRIDRVAQDRAPAPGIVDDSRLEDFSRRLDFVHHALASRIDDAETETRAHAPELESLLRALSEKLDAEPAAAIGAEALESVERRMAEISRRLELGDTEADRRLQRAIEQITERLDLARDPEREDRNAREIADLREKTESSDRRAQQTLSAVHETLEKVVDRLAMIEEDVIEARGAAEAAARAPATPAPDGWTRPDVDADDFLMEPGAGRPGERQDHSRAFSLRDRDEMEPEDEVLGFGARAEAAEQAEAKPSQSNYIDVARRALAARVAAEAAEKFDADKQQRSGAPAPAAEQASARFVRPLKVSGKGGSRRMPALLFTAVSVLAIGAYQAYRIFDNSTPPMQAVPAPRADNGQPAAQAPGQSPALAPAPAADATPPKPVEPAKPVESAAPPATAFPAAPGPQSSAAPVAMPTATLNSAPIMPSAVLAPKSGKVSDIGKSAGLPDPLATGAIGARPNTLSAVQAGAQAVAIKDMAEKGDPAAQFDYGARLAEGRGVNQDKGAAVGWFEKAAAQGLPQAQYRLGAIYEKGVGAPRDPAKARDFYEKAANQGNVRAMHNLAVILAEGVDGKPDYAAAANWFRRAAEYGVRDSQFNLAILYARGMGVPKNLGQSYLWFAVAAQQGDEDAAKKRDEVGAQLDAATLGAAKKQVADFHAKTPAPAVNEPPAATVSTGAAASAVSAAVGKALSKI